MNRPNIIILNPDEMRWDTMGHMGNPAAITPHLDAFAAEEAVSFSQAYCQNPVCVPSRCSFLTGLYPHTRGHRTMQYLMHENEPTLFSQLKDAGYYVWMNSRNDFVAGQIPGLAERHASEIYFYDKTKPVTVVDPAMMQKRMAAAGKKENPYPYSHFHGLASGGNNDWDDTCAACDRILHPVEPEKPLCLFLGWVNPHPPYQAEEPYYSSIDRSKLPPRITAEDCEGKSRMIHALQELCGMQNYTEEKWTELRAVYLAQCTMVDDMFQMVCDALKQAGMYDNSAIFVLSDHGDFCGDFDLPEKAQNTFEDCLVRVPLLIKPPKGCELDPGITDSLAELVDFYATAIDYAGVEPDQTHFGRSLRPVVENRKNQVRNFVCAEGGRLPGETHCDEWHAEGPDGPALANAYWPKKTAQKDDLTHEKGTMIFDGRYKYVRRPSGGDELYDMHREKGDCVNLFAERNAEEDAAVQKLRMHLLDWYQQTCDVVPRTYDNRFTEERLWTSVRHLCPPELEEEIRQYIRLESPTIMQAIRYTMGRRAAARKDA